MELIIKWKDFKSAVQDFIDEANDILYFERESLNENGLTNLETLIKSWIEKSRKYLRNSFKETNNEFIIGFESAKPYSSYLKSKADRTVLLNKLLDELNTKKKTLEYYIELLSISDAVIQPKLIDREVRASYSRREIIDLVLDKLHHLYNQKYYPIHHILTGNAIKVTKESIFEIVEILEQKKYIQVVNNRSILVQLSSNGKEFVEDKRSFDLITKESSLEPEIEKVSFIEKEVNGRITPEPIYHHFEKQFVS